MKAHKITYTDKGAPSLSEGSRAFIELAFAQGATITDISGMCGVTRQYIYWLLKGNDINRPQVVHMKPKRTRAKKTRAVTKKRGLDGANEAIMLYNGKVSKTELKEMHDNGLSYADLRRMMKIIVCLTKDDINGICRGVIPASLSPYYTSLGQFPMVLSMPILALQGDVSNAKIDNLIRIIERIFPKSEIDGAIPMDMTDITRLIMKYIRKYVNRTFSELFSLKEDEKPEVILYGSAGSGKSVTAANYIIYKMLEHPDNNALILRKESNTLDFSVVNEIVKVLDYNEIPYKQNITDKVIRLTIPGRDTQEIYFRGLDDVQKLLSIVPAHGSLTHVLIEEAIAITQDDYDVVTTRLRGGMREKQIMLVLNPFSKESWIYKRWFANENPDSLNIKRSWRHKSTWRDNPFLTDGDKQRLHMLRENNPRLAKVLLDGEWGVLGDRIFDPENYVIAEGEPNWGSLTLLAYGVDFGFKRDPSAIIAIYQDELNNGQIYARELYYNRVPAVEDLATIIHGLAVNGYIDLTQRFYCDTQPPDATEVLIRRNIWAIPATKGAGSIMNGIQSIISLKPVIWGENLVREFEEYVYKKDKNGNTGNPEDSNNHLIDALRYAICDIKIYKGGAY